MIPSKGRSNTVGNTVDLLGKNDTYVYVHEDEYDDYIKVLNKDQLRTHNVFGIGAIRKFMYDKNKNQNYVFQLDDDVTAFEYKFTDGKIDIIVDRGHIRDIVDNMYQVAYDIGTPLFCPSAGVGPLLYTQLNLCYFSGFVNIVGAGIIPSLMGDINFDPRFTVMHEDHDLTLQVKYHKRYVFIDARYSVRSPSGNLNPAGLSTIRNKPEHDKCRKLLLKKFGSVVQPSPKKENRIILKTPF